MPTRRISEKTRNTGAHVDPARVSYALPTDLTPDPRNPRVHGREQIAAIAKSIRAFGFNAPVLVTGNNRIVAGHGRVEAAKLLRLDKIPVIRLEHLTELQAQAYMLADNKLADRSTWDDKALAGHLKSLREIVLDFDIEAIGFEPPEFDLRVQSLDPPDAMDEADEFAPPTGVAVSRLGDIWTLGRHRLVCGNALEARSYDFVLSGELAAATFTDPPYNVRINGHVTGKGRKRHTEFAMASGEMDRGEFTAFLGAWLGLAGSHAAKEAVHFMCMDWRHLVEATAAIERAKCELLNLCVWVKTNGGMGSLYRSRHELVFVFRGHGARHRNNVQLGSFGRNRTNVWNYAGMNSFAARGRVRGIDLHPTVKPVGMVADAILDVTRQDDIVLDSFCGSGTTILAAERTGRRGYGIELDPLYVDLAIRRWQQMTKQQARHVNGKTFDELLIERAASSTGS